MRSRRENLAFQRKRRGAVMVLMAVLLPVLVGMVAFGVDVGYIMFVRSQAQRAADAAALAGARELANSNVILGADNARSKARAIANKNVTTHLTGYTITDADIEVGQFNPATIYTTGPEFLPSPTGVNTMCRVTLRLDGTNNPQLPLFFGVIFGQNKAPIVVSASAVLQRASDDLVPGAKILPIGVPVDVWDALQTGDQLKIYGDRLEFNENTISGNYGTVDIGSDANSTSNLAEQTLDGFSHEDLSGLISGGRVTSGSDAVDPPLWVDADPGFSRGFENQGTDLVIGEMRLIPLYDDARGTVGEVVDGSGDNFEIHVTGWAIALVVDSHLVGAPKFRRIVVERLPGGYYLHGLKPYGDLSHSGGDGIVAGGFTAPVLVQ